MSLSYSIRNIRAEDAEGLAALQALPGYRFGTLRLPFPPLDSVRAFVASKQPDLTHLVAEADGQIIGNVSLRRLDGRRIHAAGLAMGVHDNHVGKGVGSALLAAMIDMADNWLALRRLELTVYSDNIAGLTLYRKFGFAEEGRHRDFAFRDGEYVDAFCMARVRAPK